MPFGTKIGLFLIRVVAGATFILAGMSKIWPNFDFSKFSAGWLKTEALKSWLTMTAGGIRPEFAFFKSLAQDVFIKYASSMTYLIVFGELLVGIALIVGFLTRIASAFGILMTAAFFFATCSAGFLPHAMVTNTAFLVCMFCIVTLISGSGMVGGIDGKIRNRG